MMQKHDLILSHKSSRQSLHFTFMKLEKGASIPVECCQSGQLERWRSSPQVSNRSRGINSNNIVTLPAHDLRAANFLPPVGSLLEEDYDYCLSHSPAVRKLPMSQRKWVAPLVSTEGNEDLILHARNSQWQHPPPLTAARSKDLA